MLTADDVLYLRVEQVRQILIILHAPIEHVTVGHELR